MIKLDCLGYSTHGCHVTVCMTQPVNEDAGACMQVRDMTGTGAVMKRRIKEGTGQFPMDCPMEDSRLQIHYRFQTLCSVMNMQLCTSSTHVYVTSSAVAGKPGSLHTLQ